MNCKQFLDLEEYDKAVYMASLIHVCQSDDEYFTKGQQLIDEGHKKGLFKGIKLFPNYDLPPNGNETRNEDI